MVVVCGIIEFIGEAIQTMLWLPNFEVSIRWWINTRPRRTMMAAWLSQQIRVCNSCLEA